MGPISIATTYLPPRRSSLPYSDFHKLLYNIHPIYIFGDLNAKHNLIGDTRSNNVGKGIATFMKNGKAIHLGPNFPTYFSHNNASSPDIAIANNKITHNITINPGPITTSYHIPVIITLTATAITIPTNPTPNKWKADREKLKDDINQKMDNIIIEQNMNKEQI